MANLRRLYSKFMRLITVIKLLRLQRKQSNPSLRLPRVKAARQEAAARCGGAPRRRGAQGACAPSADPRRGHLAAEISVANGLDSAARCLYPARLPCAPTPRALSPDSLCPAPPLHVPCAPTPCALRPNALCPISPRPEGRMRPAPTLRVGQ